MEEQSNIQWEARMLSGRQWAASVLAYCTCILYLNTSQRNHSLVKGIIPLRMYLHTILPRASPGPRKGMIPLTSKKKKKSGEKKEASAPIREPLNQRQTAEPPFSQVSPIARDEKLIFIKNAHSCAF